MPFFSSNFHDMPNLLEFILLFAGLGTIIVLSLIIERKVRAQLSAKIAPGSYLLIAAIAFYYLLDAVLGTGPDTNRPFILFWFTLILAELALYFKKMRSQKK